MISNIRKITVAHGFIQTYDGNWLNLRLVGRLYVVGNDVRADIYDSDGDVLINTLKSKTEAIEALYKAMTETKKGPCGPQ